MVDERTFYIVDGLWRFDSLSIPLGALEIAEDDPTHYMPVFLDRQRAEDWAEGKYQVVALKPGDTLMVVPANALDETDRRTMR